MCGGEDKAEKENVRWRLEKIRQRKKRKEKRERKKKKKINKGIMEILPFPNGLENRLSSPSESAPSMKPQLKLF